MGRQLTKITTTQSFNDHDHGPETPGVPVSSQPDDRIVGLTTDINEMSATVVIAGLLSLSSKVSEPINFIINTPGGSVHEMFAIYDVMKYVKCPIKTIGLGKVMSAGVLLLAAGKKGERLIGASTTMLIHQVMSVNIGNVFEQKLQLKETERLQTKMFEAYKRETGLSDKRLKTLLDSGRDVILDAHEAVKLGFADKVIG